MKRFVGFVLSMGDPCSVDPSQTIVQLTASECQCCQELEDFIQDNDYTYLLFYGHSRLNTEIGAKFTMFSEEWKYSRVKFGKIDVNQDREMASKWVEPNMIPTNVMYKFGKPVDVMPKDFEIIRDKHQGNPSGHKWLLEKYLGDDPQASNLHFVRPLPSKKKFKRFIKVNEVAIVGFFEKQTGKEAKLFDEAVWRLFQEAGGEDLGAVFASGPPSKLNITAPAVQVYLDGKLVQDDGTFNDEWKMKSLMAFLRGFLPVSDEGDADARDEM